MENLAPALNSVEHGRIDGAGRDGLSQDSLIARSDNRALISLGIEAEVLQCEHRARPNGAIGRLHVELFAA